MQSVIPQPGVSPNHVCLSPTAGAATGAHGSEGELRTLLETLTENLLGLSLGFYVFVELIHKLDPFGRGELGVSVEN